jgi:hypothetical protein
MLYVPTNPNKNILKAPIIFGLCPYIFGLRPKNIGLLIIPHCIDGVCVSECCMFQPPPKKKTSTKNALIRFKYFMAFYKYCPFKTQIERNGLNL